MVFFVHTRSLYAIKVAIYVPEDVTNASLQQVRLVHLSHSKVGVVAFVVVKTVGALHYACCQVRCNQQVGCTHPEVFHGV
jgi:hypothetical protein